MTSDVILRCSAVLLTLFNIPAAHPYTHFHTNSALGLLDHPGQHLSANEADSSLSPFVFQRRPVFTIHFSQKGGEILGQIEANSHYADNFPQGFVQSFFTLWDDWVAAQCVLLCQSTSSSASSVFSLRARVQLWNWLQNDFRIYCCIIIIVVLLLLLFLLSWLWQLLFLNNRNHASINCPLQNSFL